MPLPSVFGTNDGTIVGSVTLGEPGPLAAPGSLSYHFNGNGYISVSMPLRALTAPVSSIAIECWAKVDASMGSGTMGGFIGASGPYGFFDLEGNANAVRFEARNAAVGNGTSYSLNATTWHHYVLSMIGGVPVGYVDGVAVWTNSPYVGDTSFTGQFGPGIIGVWDTYLSGNLAELAVYAPGLSPARVQAHYQAAQSTDPTAYPSAVLADQPIAYWRLNETSGTIAHDSSRIVAARVQGPALAAGAAVPDSSGNGKTGTVNGPGIWHSADSPITGGPGSVYFGVNSDAAYIWAPTPLPTYPNTAYGTLEVWFKVANPANPVGNIAYIPAFMDFIIIPQGNNEFLRFECGLPSPFSTFPSYNVADGNWHHAVMTVDASGNVAGYIDGQQVVTGTCQLPTLGSGYNIGGYSGLGPGADFNGNIAEVAIYPTPLSATRVQAHYNARTSNSAYVSAVLADSPAQWLRLGDVVAGLPATRILSPVR